MALLNIGSFALGAGSTIPTGFSSANAFTVAASGLGTINGNIAKKNGVGTIKGVIVFFSISDGSSYWNVTGSADLAGFFTALANAGYHSVMVKFTGVTGVPGGWTLAANGVASGQVALAIRPATVIKWVYDNWYASLSPLPTPGLGETGFCVTGVSGGSAAITYAIERYTDPADSTDLADIVNVCIPCSGPPMAQIGKGCIEDASYDYTINNDRLIDNSYGYDASYGNEAAGPCLLHTNTAPQLAIWAANSVETCGTVYNYPTTRMHIIEGSSDTNTLRAHIADYYSVLVGASQPMLTKQTVTGMPHIIQNSQDGIDALYTAITAPAAPVGPTPIQASSPEYDDVNFAVNGGGPDSLGKTFTSAPEGSTVLIPSGTASWTTQLTLSVGITLQGATTVVRNAGDFATADQYFTWDDQTTILDNVDANDPNNPAEQVSIIGIQPVSVNQNYRISGLTLFEGTVVDASRTKGLYATGTNHNVRIDNCHIKLKKHRWAFFCDGEILGVMDHNVIEGINGTNEIVYIEHTGWGDDPTGVGPGGTGQRSDGSWADDPYWGTNKFFFIEDNYFRNAQTGTTNLTNKNGSVDGQGGTRCTYRYNVAFNTRVGTHGTESGGRGLRAGRAWDVNNNIFFYTVSGALNQFRGGSCLNWGNTYKKSGGSNVVIGPPLIANRQINAKTLGKATGENPFDDFDTTDYSGNGIGGGPSGLKASGTHTATEHNTIMTDNTKNFSSSLVGYEITNLKADAVINRTSGSQISSFIQISTPTAGLTMEIPFTGLPSAGNPKLWQTGDKYEIRRNFRTVDQPGNGKGDLLEDVDNPTPVNLNQALEPLYSWLNTLNGAAFLNYFHTASPTIVANRDFYNQVASFTGATGVGSGLIVSRPASGLTAGVGYWATDESKFYVATGATTWALLYQPYTYPHPLVSGAEATAVPVLTPPAGTYVVSGSTKDITASTSTAGAQMRYTTDGVTVPTATVGTLIASTSGIITLGLGTTTIQIIAFASGMDLSPINTSNYTISSATTKIISLAARDGGSALLFGGIIVGLTGSLVLRIFNTGSGTLNVSSITYPTGYTGAYAGAILADDYHDVTVVFTPVTAIAYNGTITVNSDATSGTNTIPVSGRGTPASSGGGGILPGTRRKIGLMTE